MRVISRWLLGILCVAGCDRVFVLTPVEHRDAALDDALDAESDVAPDVAVDMPASCATGPVILGAVATSMVTWTNQVPTSGTHADKVDDPVSDEDQTYIATPSDGQVDLFTHVPLVEGVTIDSVTFYVRARIEVDNTLPAVAPAFFSGTLEWDDRVITTSYTDVASNVYVNDPATTMPWTVGAVNAATIGVRKSYNTDPVRVTRIWASVECH